MPDQPMSEQLGLPPAMQAQLMMALQQRQNPQGMTQISPQLGNINIPQPKPFTPRQQSVAQPGNDRQSLQNLGVSVSNVVGQLSQKIQERKAKEMQFVADRFTQSWAGVQQAQSQMQQAQQMSQQAAQEFQQATDPQAKQAAAMKLRQASQMLTSAQQSMKQNSDILNTEYDYRDPKGQKRLKMLQKGLGIDEKTMNSPEHQAVRQSFQKLGVGQGAASILSSVPQTMQLSPEAQQQQLTQGLYGKPLSQDQAVRSATEIATKGAHEQGITKRADTRAQLQAALNGMQYDASGKLVPADPATMSPIVKAKMSAEQAATELKQAQTEYERTKTMMAPEQAKLAQARIASLQGNLMMRQKEFGIKVEEESRKRLETEAKGINAAGGPDVAAVTGGKPLQSWAQQTIATSMPVLDQIDGLMDKIKELGLQDNNQAGYLFMPRLEYAMGFGSDEGKLASEISNISLIQVTGAARVLKGSSRAYQALGWAAQHLPDAWKSSPKQMMQQLQFVKENLNNIMQEATTYGIKNMSQGEAESLMHKKDGGKPKDKPSEGVSYDDFKKVLDGAK